MYLVRPGTYYDCMQIGHTYEYRLHIGAYVVAGALSPTTLAALSFRCVAAEAQAEDIMYDIMYRRSATLNTC